MVVGQPAWSSIPQHKWSQELATVNIGSRLSEGSVDFETTWAATFLTKPGLRLSLLNSLQSFLISGLKDEVSNLIEQLNNVWLLPHILSVFVASGILRLQKAREAYPFLYQSQHIMFFFLKESKNWSWFSYLRRVYNFAIK